MIMNTDMRRLFTPLARGVVICLLGASGFTSAAAITEVEPNDTISSAQPIAVPPEGLSISAVIGKIGAGYTTDVDFFAFTGTQGDTPSINIVGAMKPDATGICNGFSSIIALYDTAGNLLAQGEANCPVADASLGNVTLSANGTYVVAVSGYPHYWDQGAVALNIDMPSPGGDYQLVISGVKDLTPKPASTKHVPIEVRHWRDEERDLERRKGMDPITVAILSMQDFDAMTVDPKSLTFGATGDEKSLFRCRKEGKDINRDGLLDMVCYFKPDVANFQIGHLNGILKGKTKTGQQIDGTAALKIYSVPTEKRRFRQHDEHHSDRDDDRNEKDKHDKR
jgi:hypothetical protein